jgi:hypothetical protein
MPVLKLESDHPIPAATLGGTVTLRVISGDVVYYGSDPSVDQNNNLGQLAAGSSVTLRDDAWIISASDSAVNMQVTFPAAPAGSFLRAFGPDTSTQVPANAWTAIVLDPAGEPWRQFGTQCWEWIGPGDPDYSLSPAGIRCQREGIYDLTGSVVFDIGQGTGTRGVRVIEVKGPYAGQWQLATSVPMPKASLIPVIVGGETYQYVGNIVELQAWTDTATQTAANPQSEWLSAAWIGSGP